LVNWLQRIRRKTTLASCLRTRRRHIHQRWTARVSQSYLVMMCKDDGFLRFPVQLFVQSMLYVYIPIGKNCRYYSPNFPSLVPDSRTTPLQYHHHHHVSSSPKLPSPTRSQPVALQMTIRPQHLHILYKSGMRH
jgi:hypothetical protein